MPLTQTNPPTEKPMHKHNNNNNDSTKQCRHRRRRQRQQQPTNTTSCRGHVQHRNVWQQIAWRWARRHRPALTSYRMAVLANMAYWQFHEWDPHGKGEDDDDDESVLGFSIEKKKTKKQPKMGAMRRWWNKQWCRWWNGVHWILAQSNPIVVADSLLPNPTSQGNSFTTFQYYLYNWREPSGVVSFHDTDVLISSHGSSLVIAFAGTASTADAFTNIQTFEPAHHSSFFHGGGKNVTTTTNRNRKHKHTVQGSVHRGFLNAYSRVRRGSVLRVCGRGDPDCTRQNKRRGSLFLPLDNRFGHCTGRNSGGRRQQNKRHHNNTNSATSRRQETLHASIHDHVRRQDSGGCHSTRGGEKLATILRELASHALNRGSTVHIVGHSLGGGTATIMALDLIVNFPEIPVSRLHCWTFGAPQVADSVFLQSLVQLAPRLGKFVMEQGVDDPNHIGKDEQSRLSPQSRRRKRARHNGRFHRFVTLSNDCKVDIVSEVTKRALAAHKSNFRGTVSRRLGGVKGYVVHLADPHYLLTPHQYYNSDSPHGESNLCNDTEAGQSRTKSTVAAHSLINYLDGISRESRNHPLRPTLPTRMAEFVLKSNDVG